MSVAGSTATGAGAGAATGAAIGSALPGYGTAIGAGIGAVAGGVAGYFKGSSEQDARKRKAKAWEKAHKILAQAQAVRDAKLAGLTRDVYAPVNNTMMGMYGQGAGVDMANMTQGAQPKQQQPQQGPSYAPKGR